MPIYDASSPYYNTSVVDNYLDVMINRPIPKSVDDEYGISESMAEYEAEEEDELQEWYEDGVEKTGLTPHKAHE